MKKLYPTVKIVSKKAQDANHTMPQESAINKNATELDHLSYDDFELRKSRFGQETLVNEKENTLCENDVEEEGNENKDGDNEEEEPYEE